MDYSGGCQCGAIRYLARAPRDRASVCYCRMCQKASGQPFMAFVRFRADRVSWSRPPAIFASSTIVERGFCAVCGTPLSYRQIAGEYVSLTLHSLDDPAALAPEMAFSPETQAPWCLTLGHLPAGPDVADLPDFVSNQQPDG
ncbi:MAG: GFA family protein [Proteobacteria bacterium]|nr:GFA family protein [Pseudomonadota bacterium]